MKSKELNEILNKTRRTPNISLTPEQVEELVKDLKKLDHIKLLVERYNDGVGGCIDFVLGVKEVLNNGKD